MTTEDDNSAEGEVVPCSLPPHYDTNRHIAEINNVACRGGDPDQSDVESDNVSNDDGEDDDYHDRTTMTWTTLMMLYQRATPVFVPEQPTIMRMRY